MFHKIISSLLIFFIIFSNFSTSFADETKIPDIKITLQNPSYLLDKELELEEYFCDKSKGECKVNFDLTTTFWSSIPSTFACENNFSFTTWEEVKCNPNTITFPNWIYSITFKIYEKTNPENFKTKNIIINNEITTIEIPDVNIEIQSWLSSENWINKCSNQNDCKLNLNLENLFSEYNISNYVCEWDFWWWIFETIDTDKKCNPWYVSYWTWYFSVNAKVYQKDKKENFKEWILIFENIVEDSETNSGEQDNNESLVSDNLIDSESSSEWQLSTDSESNSWWLNLLQIPDVNIEIQSWLELINWNYECKNTDCKINLNLENLFTWTYDKTNYKCLWNFWSGTFETQDTDKKCNPWYVNYWTWNQFIEAKIYEKWNELNFKTWSLSFMNWNSKNLETSLWWSSGTESWNYDNLTYSWSSQEWQVSNFPSIKINFQNPSYLVDKNTELSEYVCDSKESECKINFDLSESFSWFTETHYKCNIILPFESSEKEKCNPNTITFPIWESEVWFKIYEKNNTEIFTWKTIIIKNEKSIQKSWWGWSNNYIEDIKDIILQSWWNKILNNTFECNDEVCKINLKYEKNYRDICLWDFWWWNFKEKYLNTCNPWTIYYPPWTYNINLKVFKNWDLSIFSSKNIKIINKFIDIQKEQNIAPIAKITIQWTIWKNKELIWNKLICKNSKTCSVNFDWRESSDANSDNLDFFWDFWNWVYEYKSNPKWVEYLPWKYKITLEVTDKYWESSNDYFFVEVYEKEIEELKINENISKYIKIVEALPNPIWKEEWEWIKIKNNSLNFINIKWLELDDKVWAWSKSYKIDYDLILLPYQEKKFYKSETKINLNNSFDEANLVYNKIVIDSLVWNYEVPEWFIVKKDIQNEKVKIIDVIDWDTITIQYSDWKKEKLRLIWVDTPETKHPKKELEFYWKESSDFTKKSLFWKEIELELDVENYRDKYGRLLGYVWVETEWQSLINFNQLLIEKWYGRAYLRFPFKYSKEFEKAEKEAKKNKLWIWWNEEMIKEIKLIEKLEKELDFKNEKYLEIWDYKLFIWKLTNYFSFDYFWEKSKYLFSLLKKEEISEKEILKEFDLLIKETIKLESAKIVNTQNKKIISYKTSKLKSWLKITWNTYPNSEIKLILNDFEYKTNSDELWNYLFLLTENLTVWEHKMQFLVSNPDWVSSYLAPRNLTLSKDYIFWVQDYFIKQANKKLKSKKTKKTVKIAKAAVPKKLKYDIKDTKKEVSQSETSKDKSILIFLLTLLLWIFWVVLINKVD